MSNRIYNTRKRFFQRQCNLNLNHIEKYYNINDFKVSLKKIDDINDKLILNYERIFETDRIKKILKNNYITCNRVILPIELNDIIIHFLQYRDYINIVININIPEQYLFISLNWSLILAQTNIITKKYTPKELSIFFNYQIENYNDRMLKNTNPSLHIDKEILIFISNILDAFRWFIIN